jgi:uncharacterized membrane protein
VESREVRPCHSPQGERPSSKKRRIHHHLPSNRISSEGRKKLAWNLLRVSFSQTFLFFFLSLSLSSHLLFIFWKFVLIYLIFIDWTEDSVSYAHFFFFFIFFQTFLIVAPIINEVISRPCRFCYFFIFIFWFWKFVPVSSVCFSSFLPVSESLV